MSVSRKLLTATALGSALAAQAVSAQTSVSILLDPMGQSVAAEVIGTAVEPASGFVRGCLGSVAPEAEALSFQVPPDAAELMLSAAGDGVQSLVVRLPDGLYACANAVDDLGANHVIARPQPGQYLVMPGLAEEGVSVLASVFAQTFAAFDMPGFDPFSGQPFAGGTETLDPALLGPARSGVQMLDPVAAGETRQMLARAPIVATDEAARFAPAGLWCAGFIGADAPDVVLQVTDPQRALSLFTLSDADPVLVVIAPGGQMYCNDDAFGLNSGLTIENAMPGDYLIWVGSFGPGRPGMYDLYASLGAPRWSDVEIGTDGMPRQGVVTLDPARAAERQTIASGQIVANDAIDPLTPMYCAGYIGADAPDVVLSVTPGNPLLSLYAMSEQDLTLSVLDPAGNWHCNDDAFMLMPGLTFEAPMAGEWRIWVGAYMQGTVGTYDLHATLGAPRWSDEALGWQNAPRANRFMLDATMTRGLRTQVRVAEGGDPAQAFSGECLGFIHPESPDVVVSVTQPQALLTLYAVSESDGVLMVRTPSGRLLCNDDFQMLNPGVVIDAPEVGDYAVWVGTYGGTGGVFTFGATYDVPQWVIDRDL